MATLTTSAWILHDLGLAAGFGGPLFGRLALQPAARDIHSEEERGRLMHNAWRSYNFIDGASLAVMAATWLVGRSMISGRSIDRQTRDLVRLKDVLVGAAFLTGIASIAANWEIGKETSREPVLVQPGGAPYERAPRRAGKLVRLLRYMGPLHMGLVAGVIGVTSVLAMKAGKSSKWSAVARFLP